MKTEERDQWGWGPDPLGVAISLRTGERRLLRKEQYLALDRASEARWEFFGVREDRDTGEPDVAMLEELGFSADGPEVIPGHSVEVVPGMFAPRA